MRVEGTHMDFSPWDWVNEFQLHVAACLIVGELPLSKKFPSREDLPSRADPILMKLVSAYVEWLVFHDKAERPDSPKAHMLEPAKGIDGNLPPMPPAVDLKSILGEWVSRAELCRWIHAVGMRSEYSFALRSPIGDSLADATVPAIPLDEWATRDQLIAAFGAFTGMDQTWFANLNDSPLLKKARRSTGRGGRNHVEPMFDPYEVMIWLIHPGRRKGKPMQELTGWRRLRQCFPAAYQRVEVGDPTRKSIE
jgi:hypothetical protein